MINRWKYRVHIKHLLTDETSDDVAQGIAQQIKRAIIRSQWYKECNDSYFDVTLEELGEVEDIDHLNIMLDIIYDLADEDGALIK